MPALTFQLHRCLLLGLLAALAGAGEAAVAAVDLPKTLAAIASVAAAGERAGADVPDWVKDPTVGGAFQEASYGGGEDAGSAWVSGLNDLASTRAARLEIAAKDAAIAAGTAPPKPSAVANIAFGDLRVQSLTKDFTRESGTLGTVTHAFEQLTRISHPLFTVKVFTSEGGEITAAGGGGIATVRTEWTTPTPISGAQVAKACAAGGVLLAAQHTPTGHAQSYQWFVALPAAVPAPEGEGEGYLLPLQAMAVALAAELRASGLDHLLGASVERSAPDTIAISWPRSKSSLTLRLDRDGAVIGLNAVEVITATEGGLSGFAKETLAAHAGAAVTVKRSRCGETWVVPAH